MAQDSNDLRLVPLHSHQYRTIAEWEFGPQENVDWPRYEAEMNAPQWGHYGLYKDGVFVGCVSLEWIDSQTVAYHVVTDRHRVHPRALAQVLLNVAGYLFALGNTALVVRIPREKRAAAILAIRCGMKEDAGTDKERHFTLTKSRYLKNG